MNFGKSLYRKLSLDLVRLRVARCGLKKGCSFPVAGCRRKCEESLFFSKCASCNERYSSIRKSYSLNDSPLRKSAGSAGNFLLRVSCCVFRVEIVAGYEFQVVSVACCQLPAERFAKVFCFRPMNSICKPKDVEMNFGKSLYRKLRLI